MAARLGIAREDVVDAALAVVAQDGADLLTMGRVARRLGIRTQSVYAHVDGIDGLRRAVAVHGLERLREATTAAALGTAGADAVGRIIRAHLAFALEEPELYDLSIHPPGDDPDLAVAVAGAGAPLTAVLGSCGVGADDAVHWTRLLLATVGGFARLRATGRFALPVDDEETSERVVAMLIAALPVPGPS